MRKEMTAGLIGAGLFGSLAMAAPAAAIPASSDQPVEIHGSFKTADGVPYPYVRWVAKSKDGAITDRGITDASGSFAVLTSPGADTEIAFDGLQGRQQAADGEGPDTNSLERAARMACSARRLGMVW